MEIAVILFYRREPREQRLEPPSLLRFLRLLLLVFKQVGDLQNESRDLDAYS